jgi:uncharacterized RDD family membrane protein YckC
MSEAGAAPRANVEYVGFWKRTLATAIDTTIMIVVIVPLLLAIYGTGYMDLMQEGGGFAGIWDFLLQVVLPAFAVILFWKFRGATPGKLAISAKIVDAESGGPPSTGRLVARYFAYILSALPLGVGFLWIAFDRRKQGFHDKIARTVVVEDDD